MSEIRNMSEAVLTQNADTENLSRIQMYIRGCKDCIDVDCIRPVFIWRAPGGLGQFTMEIAKDAEFRNIIFLRDTHEHYYAYDGAELQSGTVYYARIRSGIGPWHVLKFTTASMKDF